MVTETQHLIIRIREIQETSRNSRNVSWSLLHSSKSVDFLEKLLKRIPAIHSQYTLGWIGALTSKSLKMQ